MEKIKAYAQGFVAKYDQFVNACDSVENSGKWDKEANGEMDAYYVGDLSSVVICLVAADGKFSVKEAEFIREMFGFEYTPGQLRSVYENCRENMEHIVEYELQKDLDELKNINEKLAGLFKELLVLSCQIIAGSDRKLTTAEQEMIERISALEG